MCTVAFLGSASEPLNLDLGVKTFLFGPEMFFIRGIKVFDFNPVTFEGLSIEYSNVAIGSVFLEAAPAAEALSKHLHVGVVGSWWIC